MSLTANPPRWAEALLRVFLKPDDFESVSGDLLEQYRDSVYHSRGRLRADLWYVSQVFTFAPPGTRLFAVLFGAQFLTRTALDWFLPPVDFHFRSAISTVVGIGTLAAAGFWAAWRSGSFAIGPIAGSLTAGIASIASIGGAAIMLTVWHDPQTMSAIRNSGGIEEVFSLPLLMVLAGLLFGACGGIASAGLKRLLVSSHCPKS